MAELHVGLEPETPEDETLTYKATVHIIIIIIH